MADINRIDELGRLLAAETSRVAHLEAENAELRKGSTVEGGRQSKRHWKEIAREERRRRRAAESEVLAGIVPEFRHRGPNDTPASTLLDAAWKLRNGYEAGGSDTRAGVATLLERVAEVLAPGTKSSYEGHDPASRWVPPLPPAPDEDVQQVIYRTLYDAGVVFDSAHVVPLVETAIHDYLREQG